MKIEIQSAQLEDKSILRNLMELCQHDYSEFDGADVDSHGLFGYKYLDNYWTESGRYPFLIRENGKLLGLVLVRRIASSDNAVAHSIAEFFILRKYRRQGIGRTVAHRIFDMFPGDWSVAQEEGNHPAQAFWRRVVSEYTQGDFQALHSNNEEWKGPLLKFRTKAEG